jgi:hypothetical protein
MHKFFRNINKLEYLLLIIVLLLQLKQIHANINFSKGKTLF